jgi:hypothetical protein
VRLAPQTLSAKQMNRPVPSKHPSTAAHFSYKSFIVSFAAIAWQRQTLIDKRLLLLSDKIRR